MAGSALCVQVVSRQARSRKAGSWSPEDASALERMHQPYLPLGVFDYHEQKLAQGSASLAYSFSTGSSAARSWAVPDGCVDLSFGIGPSDIVAVIGGTVSSARNWSFMEGRSWVGCRFRSGEALLPKDLSPEDLVDADIVLGREASEGKLGELLFEAPDQAARRQVLAEAISAWELEGAGSVAKPGTSKVRALERFAREEILRSGGCAPISSVAAAAGVSPHYLRKAFAEVHGFSPKLYARFVRFQRAMELVSGTKDQEGTPEIALSCGYADQSHLVHEFNEFAGMTPGQFRSLVKTAA
ncbi:MAG: helix-turn-helix domain-containing protein [Atopobiaceae bacterium]